MSDEIYVWIARDGERLPEDQKYYWLTIQDFHQNKPCVIRAWRNVYGFIRDGGGLIPESVILAYMDYQFPKPFEVEDGK